MTAVLSPAELDEVTRFGIHTPDIIRDMDEHFHDVVVCEGCDQPAALRLLRLCCHTSIPVCTAHHEAVLRDIERFFASRGPQCLTCKAIFQRPQTIKDVIAEVGL